LTQSGHQGLRAPSKTVPETKATNKQVIYGLHVTLPYHMKSFPEELVPLP